MLPTTPTFGVHEYQHPTATAEDTPYNVSHTGLIVEFEGVKHVLSFINGSMCLNLLGQPVDASQFDEYAVETFVTTPHKIRGVAYWNPARGCYGEVNTDPTCIEMDCLIRPGVSDHDVGTKMCRYERLPDAEDGTLQIQVRTNA